MNTTTERRYRDINGRRVIVLYADEHAANVPDPDLPFAGKQRDQWDRLWRQPVSVLWSESDVAPLTRLVTVQNMKGSYEDTSLMAEARQLEDRFMLTPASRAAAGVVIEPARTNGPAIEQAKRYATHAPINSFIGLIDEIGRTHGRILWIEEKLREYPDPDAILHEAKPWDDRLWKERRHFASITERAEKLGISERQLQMSEERTRIYATAFGRAINHLVSTDEQRAEVVALFRSELQRERERAGVIEVESRAGAPIV